MEIVFPTYKPSILLLISQRGTTTLNNSQQHNRYTRSKLVRLQQPEANCLKGFSMPTNKGLLWKGRLCIPNNEDLLKELLMEAHDSPYTIHHRNTKMHLDLKSYFWWPWINRDIVEYVSRCLTCQQIKALRYTLQDSCNP